MRTKISLLAVALCFVATLSFAADPNMGTWKLNESKSKIPSGTPKNHTVVYEAAGDGTKVTVDGTDGSGKPSHSEWTGKFDGKDYPVTGDSTSDRTLEMTMKKDGKVVQTGHIVVASDGKTRTVTTTRTEDNGKKTTSTAVYDHQ